MIKIKNPSKDIDWKFIGNKKKWIRLCPKCNKEIYHSCPWNRDASKRKMKLCQSCCRIGDKNWKFGKGYMMKGENHPMFGKHHTEETKQKISNSRKNKMSGVNNPFYGKKHSKNSKLKMSKWHKGKIVSNKTKLKIGIASKNRVRSEETKQKVRESILKRIKKLGKAGNYNPKACKYFNELNKEKGWTLQHALNGGEIDFIGYSLDAYDKDKNIIVEYDELHHKKPCIEKKDQIRQQRLINHLNCEFYRYKEWEKELIKIV